MVCWTYFKTFIIKPATPLCASVSLVKTKSGAVGGERSGGADRVTLFSGESVCQDPNLDWIRPLRPPLIDIFRRAVYLGKGYPNLSHSHSWLSQQSRTQLQRLQYAYLLSLHGPQHVAAVSRRRRPSYATERLFPVGSSGTGLIGVDLIPKFIVILPCNCLLFLVLKSY